MERLSALDVSNLRVEDRGLPVHIAALVILDGSAQGAALDLDTVRTAIGQRLHLAPRLRQVLYWPGRGLGLPVWTDAAGFDLRDHVRARRVPAPGDDTVLLQVCAELNTGRMDRSRPLWQVWLLTGLAGGRAALLIRLHHVVADGIAALAMLGALFDADPAVPAAAAPAWAPEPVPAARELAADQLRRSARALARATVQVRHPSAVAARLGGLARQAGQLARDGPAPRMSLNVPVSGHHRLLLVRADLERARAAAHAHGGTVNDLVLAAVAGGARCLLASRGELSPGLVLRASVAASVRAATDQSATGNRVGVMIVPLAVCEADPGRRLAMIAGVTAQRKRQPPYQPSARLLQRWMARTMSRQRLVNLLVSNLPGPPGPLFFAGTPVHEMFQFGVVQGNVTVSVGALSYAGQLNLDLVGDPDAAPDLTVFAAGISDTLRQLGALDTARSRPA
jgi:diacylglycerol O-acyltransferase / wax synthase